MTDSTTPRPPGRICQERLDDGNTCGGKHWARGLCHAHYNKHWASGELPVRMRKAPRLILKVHLPKSYVQKLRETAETEGRSTSEMVRIAVKHYLLDSGLLKREDD